jgi:hypothetical protein
MLLGLLHAGLLAFTFASAALFTEVWTRYTRDAIIGCYAVVVLIFVSVVVFLGDRGIPIWLNPFEILQAIYTPPYNVLRLRTFALHVLAFGGTGLVLLAIAVTRVRHAALKQLEGDNRRRWRFTLRPAVSDNPVHWRKRHIIGLAPFPILRRVPTWLGMLAVFTFSLSLLLSALRAIVGPSFFAALGRLDFDFIIYRLETSNRAQAFGELSASGITLCLLGSLIVGTRCAGSITEEKRRRTWEDLMLTPLTWDEIMSGKMRGILGCAWPHLFAYSLPMFVLGVIAGPTGVLLTGGFLIAAIIGILIAAAIGMGCSAGDTTWHADGHIRPPTQVRRYRALGR